jgi:hypothetical protein
MGRTCSFNGTLEILTFHLEELKIPLGRHGLRFEIKIKTDIKKVGYERVNWVQLAHDTIRSLALVKMAVNLRVP